MRAEKQNFFSENYFLLRLFLLIAASLLFIAADRNTNWLTPARSTLLTVLYPIRNLTALPTEGRQWLNTQITGRQNLIIENEQLKQENLLLKSSLNLAVSLELENIRLRRLLDASYQIRRSRLLIGDITHADLAAPFQRTITVDKGSSNGVQTGLPVIDAEGIVGQTVAVSTFDSIVLLITDANHAIPAQVKRNGLHVIASGNGEDLVVNDIPFDNDIIVGDVLVSSGLGGVFPAGYPVGVVTDIRENGVLSRKSARITPAAGINTNTEVLFVWPSNDTRSSAIDATAQTANE